MESASPWRFSLQVGAALACGVLLRFVVGLEPAGWLAWLAPVPLLLLAFRSSGREAGGLVFVAALVGISVNFPYRLSVFSLPIAVIATVRQAVVWTLIVTQSRRLVLRYQTAWTALAYPVFWVAVDTLAAALQGSGNETSLAYTQSACLPVLQFVSLFGVGGLLFLVALVPSTLALAISFGGRLGRAGLAYGGTALLLVAALAYGIARLQTPASGRMTTLGLVAIDDAIGPKASASYMKSIWDAYDRAIAALGAQGAQIIVLPEKIGFVAPATAARWQRHLQELAAQHHVWILAGVGIAAGPGPVNRAWLFAPEGNLAATYDKQRLAPGERGYRAGDSFLVQAIRGRTFGVAICKDMFSAALARAYGKRAVAVMLVPAWNPGPADARMEGWNTLTRGVENGYAVVRVAREGFLTVSDAYGRIVAEIQSGPLPGSALLVRVPESGQVPTLYTAIGDLFGWICVAASPVLLLTGRRRPA